jgi:ABC-type transport system involved in cytochrome bd biosynthesis fused ATPase/permease subunit
MLLIFPILTPSWRLYDYDDGHFTINDVDVRKYDAEDLHRHTTVVFQNFSRYNTTLRANVGVGQIELLDKDTCLHDALRAGGGARLLNLPNGLDTNLEYSGFDFSFPSPFPPDPLGFGGVGSMVPDRCALSGGEVSYDPPVL